jgi:hypothetical protein
MRVGMNLWEKSIGRIFKDRRNYGEERIAINQQDSEGSEKSTELELTARALELLAGHVATEHDLRDMVNEMVDARRTKTKVAEELGVSIAYLTDVMMGRRPLGGKVAAGLGGYEKVIVFRRK